MKIKIGASVIFTSLSPIMALVIQLVVTKGDFSCNEGFSCHRLTQLLWLIVPVVLLAVGLMHIFTAGEYCVYAGSIYSPTALKYL